MFTSACHTPFWLTKTRCAGSSFESALWFLPFERAWPNPFESTSGIYPKKCVFAPAASIQPPRKAENTPETTPWCGRTRVGRINPTSQSGNPCVCRFVCACAGRVASAPILRPTTGVRFERCWSESSDNLGFAKNPRCISSSSSRYH